MRAYNYLAGCQHCYYRKDGICTKQDTVFLQKLTFGRSCADLYTCMRELNIGCDGYLSLSQDPELLSDIEHLKQVLADPNRVWSCEECKQDHERLLRYLEELKQRREDD